jgi:hypothetical protein
MAPHPEPNRPIYFKTGDLRVWWMDGGMARWILDEATYNGVFGGSPNKVENDLLSDITVEATVADCTALVNGGSAVCNLIDHNLKRLIPSNAIKAKISAERQRPQHFHRQLSSAFQQGHSLHCRRQTLEQKGGEIL